MSFRLNVNAMRRAVRNLAPDAEAITREAVEVAAQSVVGDAQTDAPVKTGALKAAHFVGDYDRSRGTIEVGVATDYALVVHETHPSKPRWFVNAIRRGWDRAIGASLRRSMRRGGRPR